MISTEKKSLTTVKKPINRVKNKRSTEQSFNKETKIQKIKLKKLEGKQLTLNQFDKRKFKIKKITGNKFKILKKNRKYRIRKPKGYIYIQSTENNTIVTLTDLLGNTKSFASGGSCGFQGSRRSTPVAAKAAAEKVALEAASLGLRFICIRMKGLRRSKKRNAIKGIRQKGIKIVKIQDLTSIPHNGCRAPKKRRK